MIINGKTSKDSLLADLRWQVDMGADEAIGEEPVDRFAETTALAAERRKTQSTRAAEPPRPPPAGTGTRPGNFAEAPPGPAPAAPHDAALSARQMVDGLTTIAGLAAALEKYDGCPLKRTASNLCFCDGNPQARVMLIGEAPGRDEDLQGKPFVGRSGRLLDKILAAIGLDRHADDVSASVFITNMVFWRPPGNRKPTEAETLACLPFLHKAIELAAPRYIVCLGGTPTQRLTGRPTGILKTRGRWTSYSTGEREIALLPTLHPSYLLRNPLQKGLAWRDFLSLRMKLDE